jgi:hypothetical protein
MLTKGFMASDVLDRAEIDLILMPRANVRPPTGCPTLSYGASVSKVTYKAWRTTLFLSTVLQGAASECAEAIGEAAGKLDDIAALNDTFPDFNLKLARRSGRPALSRILSDRPRHTLEYRHHCGPENGRCG